MSPLLIRKPGELRELSRRWRKEGEIVGLVPTMGALHEGHLSLVRRAREECGKVVVSVFVNPTQFGEGEDFERYPRNLERDRRLLGEAGCDAVFAPAVEDMYGGGTTDLSSGERVFVEAGRLGELWEGEERPGHFRGVATVVAMLFNAAEPDRAYFGEKDYQQLKVIQKMVRDLLFGVKVVPCPTVREPDGLALSSRNAYLSPQERRAAGALWRALREAAERARSGERDARRLERAMEEVCRAEPLVRLQYAAVVDAETLERLGALGDRPARALIAAHVGETHLIDNAAL
ncbi:Pantothenate synthetase [Rubrobacter xylanophilus DSM 9941]|uniref:pantoate--beta-alanine ligase n=1 Tax=Rubrobacter xylanophilus TaxID=49319 RepID=UPI001C644489|nr:pantoate--beta-alanine ligase [Rubrobacter xylanophilus]QYJ15473.1 Pantothenate synthetase [Rubrobacter xylanophilus DSM 9941]